MKGTFEELCVFSPSTFSSPILVIGGVMALLPPVVMLVGVPVGSMPGPSGIAADAGEVDKTSSNAD